MNNNTRTLFGFLLASLMTTSASAALYDRGNGMIYDSALNITWLQDANYAKTSGYDVDGLMTWDESLVWVDQLVYGGFNDWRLPSANLNGSSFLSCRSVGYSYEKCPGRYDGTYDDSANNTRGEIGHLFFELGNKAFYDATGNQQNYYGFKSTSFFDSSKNQNVSFFVNQGNNFWYVELLLGAGYFDHVEDNYYAWSFLANGLQAPLFPRDDYQIAWAVRDGDVLPVNEVPVPAAAWLMGSALIGLTAIKRRKK